ncbi:MAG: carboxy terminal-processing peptidase [Pirellulaceae bacterium]|nr:carboxy terminal-processing peptidase [Pirellulaceae bacterium]
MNASKIGSVVGLLSVFLLSESLAAEEISGLVQSTDGKLMTVSVDGDWLPVVGDPCEIFIELPGVGKARVGVAAVSQVNGDVIEAKIARSTATVVPGQLVTIRSSNPARRAEMKVPILIGRQAASAKKVIEDAGLIAKFEVGLSAPAGVKPLTVYAQEPDAGARLSKGDAVVVTFYGGSVLAPSRGTDAVGSQRSPPADYSASKPAMPAIDSRPLRVAAPSVASLPVLKSRPVETPHLKNPDSKSATIVRLVATMMERHHLSGRPIDDEISRRTFDNLIDSIDRQRMYFYQSDIDEFKRYRYELGTLIRRGDIGFCYEIFRKFLLRADERVQDLRNLLALEPDFSLDEEITTDFQSRRFADDLAEIRERWRKRVKYELLKDIAVGVSVDESRHKIFVRYASGFDRMKQNSDEDLLQLAINQFLHAFDPHSSYYSSESWQDLRIQNEQQMTGIGASLKIVDGDLQVQKIIYGSPSYHHGKLQQGDRIIAVGQGATGAFVDVRGMIMQDAVQLIRGKAGTVARLKVIPNGKFEARIYSITREKFDLQKAQSTVLTGDLLPNGRRAKVGFIYLSSFYRDWHRVGEKQELAFSVTKDVHEILRRFQSEQVDMIVLDLRTNTGGSLQECIDTASLFIGSGNILQVKGRDDNVQSYGGTQAAMLNGKPMVVLTSRLTSSGAEILAGALQDYRRALVIGDDRTHGSGLVANLRDLGKELFKNTNTDFGQLKLTIQRFYRPSGDSTQVQGVESDVVLPSLTGVADTREETLPYTLEFDRISPASFVAQDHGIDEKLKGRLQSLSDARRAGSTFFQDLNQRVDTYRQQIERKAVPLNQSAFVAYQAASVPVDDSFGSLPNIPDVRNDGYLTEVLHIALDYLARHRFSQAERALQSRQYSTAIAKYQAAVLTDPQLKMGHYKLAWALATGPIRDGNLALAHAQRAVELDDGTGWVYRLALAVAQAEKGDFVAAQKELDTALQLAQPSNRSSYEFLRQRFQNRQSYPR